jgi:hypothetical protein
VKKREIKMDAAIKTNRKYPSYTLAELEAAVAAGRGNYLMVAEIKARKNGASSAFIVPQIDGGKGINRLGRM